MKYSELESRRDVKPELLFEETAKALLAEGVHLRKRGGPAVSTSLRAELFFRLLLFRHPSCSFITSRWHQSLGTLCWTWSWLTCWQSSKETRRRMFQRNSHRQRQWTLTARHHHKYGTSLLGQHKLLLPPAHKRAAQSCIFDASNTATQILFVLLWTLCKPRRAACVFSPDVEDTFAQSKWFWLEIFIAKQLLGFSERLYNTVSFLWKCLMSV